VAVRACERQLASYGRRQSHVARTTHCVSRNPARRQRHARPAALPRSIAPEPTLAISDCAAAPVGSTAGATAYRSSLRPRATLTSPLVGCCSFGRAREAARVGAACLASASTVRAGRARSGVRRRVRDLRDARDRRCRKRQERGHRGSARRDGQRQCPKTSLAVPAARPSRPMV
jgi:hypothetical protein